MGWFKKPNIFERLFQQHCVDVSAQIFWKQSPPLITLDVSQYDAIYVSKCTHVKGRSIEAISPSALYVYYLDTLNEHKAVLCSALSYRNLKIKFFCSTFVFTISLQKNKNINPL